MIWKLARLFMAFILVLSISSPQAAETLTLDNQHSYVLWSIKHLNFSTQTGKWQVNGTVLLDQDNPQNSTVEVTINIADIITGIAELDNQLKSKLFLDAKHFPTATFVSDEVEIISKNKAKVHGVLTLHGISKSVTLDVTLNKVGNNSISNRMTAGFAATTVLKRSDFGLNALPDLADEVNIEIGAEAYLPNKKGKVDASKKSDHRKFRVVTTESSKLRKSS